MVAKLRRYARIGLSVFLYYSGMMNAFHYARRKILRKGDVCVLCLHRVLAPGEQRKTCSLPGMVFLEETFEELLQYVGRRFEVISLSTFLADNGLARHSSKPRLLLTFDDGWADNYARAFPRLKKSRIPAVIFIVTSFVDQGKLFWVEKLVGAWRNPVSQEQVLRRLREEGEGEIRPEAGVEDVVERLKFMPTEKRNLILGSIVRQSSTGSAHPGVDRPLTWEQIREMKEGGIEFGSHTVCHPLLPSEDDATIERELKLAKQELEVKLGTNIRAFAYPNGAWDERVRLRVMESGYDCAFTTQRGWHRMGDDTFTIRRILLHEGNVTGRRGKFSPAMFNFTLAREN